MSPADVDRPGVAEEVAALFQRYEAALMDGDLATLDAFFWHDERLTRYGIADRQWGISALRAFRAATPAPTFTRRLEHLRVSAFGPDCAVAQVEFVRSDTSLRGFQTQTWVRFEAQGWRIVSAHVSMIPFTD